MPFERRMLMRKKRPASNGGTPLDRKRGEDHRKESSMARGGEFRAGKRGVLRLESVRLKKGTKAQQGSFRTEAKKNSKRRSAQEKKSSARPKAGVPEEDFVRHWERGAGRAFHLGGVIRRKRSVQQVLPGKSENSKGDLGIAIRYGHHGDDFPVGKGEN